MFHILWELSNGNVINQSYKFDFKCESNMNGMIIFFWLSTKGDTLTFYYITMKVVLYKTSLRFYSSSYPYCHLLKLVNSRT